MLVCLQVEIRAVHSQVLGDGIHFFSLDMDLLVGFLYFPSCVCGILVLRSFIIGRAALDRVESGRFCSEQSFLKLMHA